MKKDRASDELRPEYRRENLGQGIRGKYFEAYQKGTNPNNALNRIADQSAPGDFFVTQKK